MPNDATDKSPLSPGDFREFFNAVNFKPGTKEPASPFRWQERLVGEMINGADGAGKLFEQGLPCTISLPTAAGKTSTLDILLFALAAIRSGAYRKPGAAALPRRWFFCVDRRLIVDQTARHARELLERLQTTDVAAAKRVRYWLAEGREQPFVLYNWRGGLALPAQWDADPMAVVVCVATVDQFGSRLLFRGYGSSSKHLPVFASMLGLDSALVLDEAHLSAPFLQTAHAVGVWQSSVAPACPWSPGVRPRVGSECSGTGFPPQPLRIVQLGATPINRPQCETVFELHHDPESPDRDEWHDPDLWPRLRPGLKMLRLFNSDKPLRDRLLRDVKKSLGKVAKVAVVVNSVRLARDIFQSLEANPPTIKGASEPARAFLLTGRNRAFVRDQVVDDLENAFSSASVACPVVVVATQCIEAGYDVSFDRLISEFAPVQALIQRLGRLNRYGECKQTEALVHYRPAEKSVYGEALGEHWDWIQHFLPDGSDVSALSLERVIKNTPPPAVNTPHTPVLLSQHLDVLARTNPRPSADIDVDVLLHGQGESSPEVHLVWRADLGSGDCERWKDTVLDVPPRPLESIQIPRYEVLRWLEMIVAGSKVEFASLADLDRVEEAEDVRPDRRIAPVVVYQWQGRDEEPDCRVITDAREIRPGMFVVVPAKYGGCDRFGWAPGHSRAVEDIGDLLPAFRHRRIRLHPAVHSWLTEQVAQKIYDALSAQAQDAEAEIDPLQIALELAAEYAIDRTTGTLNPRTPSMKVELSKHPSGRGAVLHIRKPSPWQQQGFSEIFLETHEAAVAARVRPWIVDFCPALQDAVQFAALHHDEGKADPRQQTDFHGGDFVCADAWIRQGRYLAKPRARPPLKRSLPGGCRHELASVAIAAELPEFRQLRNGELALLLIGMHHGRGRAVVLPHRDPRPVTFSRCGVTIGSIHRWLTLEGGWLRAFLRRSREMGPYRLAFLQSLIIIADELQSSEEQGDEE